MALRFVLGLLLLLGCSQAGGEDDADDDTSPGGGSKRSSKPIEPSRKLELSTLTNAHLGHGARLQIRGHLVDMDDHPIDDGLVSFALVGRAQDCSLDALDARSDERGIFTNALSAGERAATFRVRVSSADASDAFVLVAVDDAGFGSLLVSTHYEGARIFAQRSVFARAEATCDGSARAEGEPVAMLGEQQAQMRLPGLPASTRYAVTAVAESQSGTLVARGCAEDVLVQADSEQPIEIELLDESLMRSGDFTLIADLDTSAPAGVVGAALRAAAEAVIEGDVPGEPAPDDAEARFLLDSLDDTLRGEANAEPGWLTLAEAVAEDRGDNAPDEPTPDHLLQGLLEIDDRGALIAIADIAESTQGELDRMRLTATLALVPTGDSPVKWQPLSIEALPTAQDADPIAIDLTLIKDVSTSRSAFIAARDVLDLSRLSLRAKLGLLSTQVLQGVLRSESDGGRLEEIHSLLGCGTLSEWLDSREYPGACDESCLEAACDHALSRLQSAAETALREFDDVRPTVTLGGECVMRDRDGDLIAETMTCDRFSGEWAAERKNGRADSIAGTASATAAASPVP